MASAAGRHVRRIIPSECPRSVVTRGAIISRTFMLLRLDSRHLAALWCTGANRMTFGAIHALGTTVFAMAEDSAKHVSSSRCSTIRCDLMAHIARTDLAFGSVTCIAIRVCFDSDRKRLPCSRRFMTRRTPLRRKALAGNMSRVHELHVESLFEFRWKFAHGWRSRFHVVVADRAHRLLLGIRELANVAADA